MYQSRLQWIQKCYLTTYIVVIYTVGMENRMTVTKLPNGLYRLFVYGPNWAGLYNADGTFYGGNTGNIRRLTAEQIKNATEEK